MRYSDDFYRKLKKSNPAIRNKKDFKKYLINNRIKFTRMYLDEYENMLPSVDEWKAMVDSTFRFACFSSDEVLPHEEILMWSHYAAKHSGARIMFTLDSDAKHLYYIKQVLYKKERVGIDLTKLNSHEETKGPLMEAVITKAEGWAYEKEYRVFFAPERCFFKKGSDGVIRSFIKFNPAVVSGIDFGINCAESEISKVSKLARVEYPNALLRKATYHKSNFAIEYKVIL